MKIEPAYDPQWPGLPRRSLPTTGEHKAHRAWMCVCERVYRRARCSECATIVCADCGGELDG